MEFIDVDEIRPGVWRVLLSIICGVGTPKMTVFNSHLHYRLRREREESDRELQQVIEERERLQAESLRIDAELVARRAARAAQQLEHQKQQQTQQEQLEKNPD